MGQMGHFIFYLAHDLDECPYRKQWKYRKITDLMLSIVFGGYVGPAALYLLGAVSISLEVIYAVTIWAYLLMVYVYKNVISREGICSTELTFLVGNIVDLLKLVCYTLLAMLVWSRIFALQRTLGKDVGARRVKCLLLAACALGMVYNVT